MNKGNTLRDLGRPDEAMAADDEMIVLLTDLVERRGRAELADSLARALVNKGNALARSGRPDEAVAACEAAIALLTDLVERRGRAELANDLAEALVNKGDALFELVGWMRR